MANAIRVEIYFLKNDSPLRKSLKLKTTLFFQSGFFYIYALKNKVQFMMEIPEIPNLIHFAIPFFVLTLIIEIVVSAREKANKYETKDAITSITMGLGNVFLGLISKGLVFAIFFYLYSNFRIFTIPFVWWSWILMLIIEDFVYYWFHRTSHLSRSF